MIRVLLVDDEALLREGLRAILEVEDDMEIVAEATNGFEAVDAARTLSPDIVLMDVQMPGMDGIEATRRVLKLSTSTRVIVLTTFDRDEYVYRALKAGASGFLLKDLRRRELVGAIRDAADGSTLLAPAVTRRLIEHFCGPSSRVVDPTRALPELTPREREVLTLIGKGLRNSEIGAQLYLGENTVKTHVGRILSKLGLRDRVQAVIVAYETGLVTPAGAPNDEPARQDSP